MIRIRVVYYFVISHLKFYSREEVMIHKRSKTMFIGLIIALVLMLTKCKGTVFSNCDTDYITIYHADTTFSPVEVDYPVTLKCTFTVPVKAQGDWLDGKACLPAAVSMVLDYYHHSDSELKTTSIEQFIAILPPGDITPGNGIYIHDIIDELQALGYQNTFYTMTPRITLKDLRGYLLSSPLIVQLGVELGHQPRKLIGVGDHQHALVLLGFSLDGQIAYVNDPWSGSQLKLPLELFLDMWNQGYNVTLVIRK